MERKTNGQQVYNAFIEKIKKLSEEENRFSLVAGSYTASCYIILPKYIDGMKREIADVDFIVDLSDGLGKDCILTQNYTSKKHPKYYNVQDFNPNEDFGNFDKIFPGYIPLAFSEAEFQYGECFLINTLDPAYSVIFVCHECVVYVTDDLESFLQTIN